MAYIKDVVKICLANDGTYILVFNSDCFEKDEENDDEMYSMNDSDDAIFTAKTVEEINTVLNDYLPKLKVKTAEELFNQV